MDLTTETELLRGDFRRPPEGPSFANSRTYSLSNLPAWRSNGGPTRSHPARSFPFTMECAAPAGSRRVHVIGVFAQYAGSGQEAPGTMGATLHGMQGENLVFRQDLVLGQHYRDAEGEPILQINGDGSSLETIGQIEIEGKELQVDALTIDVPAGLTFDSVRIRDLGSPASFTIFDVFFDAPVPHGCPFHRAGGGIPLSEVAVALRMGDRVKFQRAFDQLKAALGKSSNLDEARGQLLTFFALVTSASLEAGGGREMHWRLLDLARELERKNKASELVDLAQTYIFEVAAPMLGEAAGPSAYLIDRALAYVERNFARSLTDAIVAEELGLSTSHFRFLFRQATGQPFHKYLIGLRLEKARRLLVEQKITVSQAARSVGFSGLAHFSRAFQQRFEISPSTARRS